MHVLLQFEFNVIPIMCRIKKITISKFLLEKEMLLSNRKLVYTSIRIQPEIVRIHQKYQPHVLPFLTSTSIIARNFFLLVPLDRLK